ncbi:MAG: hypothetical protein KJZ96_02760 [Rhodocyclaceae bacterium]|nr:hypothetical protein [Rhodocyclaceae bacterium]
MRSRSPCRQGGLVLVAFVAFLLVAVGGVHVSAFSLQKARMSRERTTMVALAEAREALVAWSVSHPEHPGMLPYPDRGNDGNYDGNSDCVTAAPTPEQLLGRLPWLGQTNPCPFPHSGLMTALRDGSGQVLWMAVSRNLVYVAPGAYPEIHLALRDVPAAAPWMRVVDGRGGTLASRVAVVLIAPEGVTGSQARVGGAPAVASYLDPLAPHDHADNRDPTFIAAVPQEGFNDRIVYLTIEDWIRLLLPRVIFEVRRTLEGYRRVHGAYPEFASPGGDGVCATGTLDGFLPLSDGDCGAGNALGGFLPPGQVGRWLLSWGPDLGYRRDTPERAILDIDGVSHVITP